MEHQNSLSLNASYDLGLRCGYLLSMASVDAPILEDIFIGIRGPHIKVVEPYAGQSAHQFIDARDKLVMPGLINAHTHLPMTLFRGLSEDQTFKNWLYQTILPLESKLVSPDFVQAGTALAALESIRLGVTTLVDMYYFTPAIAEILDKSGLRALVGQTLIDYAVPDNPHRNDAAKHLFEDLVGQYLGHSRITPCIAPHAPYSCSDKTLLLAQQLCEKYNTSLMIHVSETKQELEESLKLYRKTPVERLKDLGLLHKRALFAHGVHLTTQDIELLSCAQTAVVFNPESNMKLGSGVAPVPYLLENNVAVAIGTDGTASNNNLDVLQELQTGAKLLKLIYQDKHAISAYAMLEMATIGAAKALGLEQMIGSIECGKYADLIVLNLQEPYWQPMYNIVNHLVYAASALDVETTICHGQVLMNQGQYHTLSTSDVYAQVKIYESKIKTLMRENGPF